MTEIVLQGIRGKYYIVGNSKYDIHFPQDWANNHLPDTGPDVCLNCACYGQIHGVFVCYCSNCYSQYNNNSRGDEIFNTKTTSETELWKKCPHMKDVKIEDIGYSDYWPEYCNSEFENNYDDDNTDCGTCTNRETDYLSSDEDDDDEDENQSIL